ncbi:hypothetical protein CON15_23105 [Bacillus cereus]|uniref:hypothetical protein n=1 Tax=Bacillus cereus TaxID=1396 RepID=UPI000BED6574|nr:hypothetical protein [Bacillus cereus]PDZ55088.1 hypothetical protein CON15_23105 [Bacillus cereus]PET98222.1 hypothetical protein CN531_30685 [Bacillus cereus]PEW62963.1 hypothetical protein CN443_09675 [Bacillus cereus]PEX34189.1 hypothetical protein CN459_07210 [Bacillus cereus]PEY21294.1 hypothetical protein CN331_09950 [Bacillus cereus]
MLLLVVVHIQLEMMRKGILMRGGLAVGLLCHNDNIVYGPAMVEAYELESKLAIYPRVVVKENDLKYIFELCEKNLMTNGTLTS